jgi:hypothetical protein
MSSFDSGSSCNLPVDSDQPRRRTRCYPFYSSVVRRRQNSFRDERLYSHRIHNLHMGLECEPKANTPRPLPGTVGDRGVLDDSTDRNS